FTQIDKQRGFNLAKDALMRVSILRTGDQMYRFIWSFHHIVMDGWCLPLLTGEVFGSYFAFIEQREPELAPVTPHRHYIEWLERQDSAAAAEYWKGYLIGYNQQTALPNEKSKEASTGYVVETLYCLLDKELSQNLNRIAKEHQVTINTLMQTA